MSRSETYQYRLQPLKYGVYLEAITNSKYLDKTRQKLLPIKNFLEENNICAVVVGSDGKSERHPQSKTEIVYIQDQSSSQTITTEEITDVYTKTTGFDYVKVFGTDIDSIPEKVDLGKRVISFAFGDAKRIFPDRVLNSILVIGSAEIHQKARRMVLEELGSGGQLSSVIKKELKRQRKEHYKTCLTGSSRGKVCFNHNGQFYDESKHPGRFGFKHGFIRLIQRDLDLRTQEMIVRGTWSINRAIELPSSTTGRISFLDYSKDTAEAFLWFLQRYHSVQEEYKNRRIPSFMPFDDYDFKQCSEIILRTQERL